jgi:twitching motility protein PilT
VIEEPAHAASSIEVIGEDAEPVEEPPAPISERPHVVVSAAEREPATAAAEDDEPEVYELEAEAEADAGAELPDLVAEEAPVPAVAAYSDASASAAGEAEPAYAATSSREEPAEPASPLPPPAPEPRPVPVAPVIPMTRTLRIEVPPSPPRIGGGRQAGIERLLSLAAARGASALYLTCQSRPFLRVDGDIRILDGEPASTSADIESAVLELMPEMGRDAVRKGEPAEWVCDLPDIGRIRCSTFRDYRGPGALFHLISARPLSAEQLGLNREMQALATEAEGLVLIASPRGGGKSTLLSGFVDLINRQRPDYVITLERQIRLVHDNRSALISQREVRGNPDQVLTVARGALRENPDVLVIDDLPSPDIFQLALDAAGTGLLVFATVAAGSTTAALTRVLEIFPPDRRKAVQSALAERLRGVVAQVLLRKAGGGRLAARELLVTTGAVASLLAEGQIADLPLAIESGRRYGMTPLNDALVGFVRSHAIDVREAYRKADDRDGLLMTLKREGIDTSFVERLA